MRYFVLLCAAVLFLAGTGCGLSPKTGVEDVGYPLMEPEWIRNGETVEFDNEMWYPTREVENLLEYEVYPLVELKGVQFYIERTDIKPFQRLYTYFAKDRYRAFEKNHD